MMKTIKRFIATTVAVLVLVLGNIGEVKGQCTNTNSYLNGDAPTGGATVPLGTCFYRGEYTRINNTVIGETYEINLNCGSGGEFITIRSGTSGGTAVAFGNAPLTFTATTTGPYYAHFNTDSGCGTVSSCCTVTLTHIISECENSTMNGTINAPTGGTTSTISNCQARNEYAVINNVIGGDKYELGLTCGSGGTFITVRSNSVGGTIIASGAAPLEFNAPSNGSYYIHYNTDNACGTDVSCCTSTISHVVVDCINTGNFT